MDAQGRLFSPIFFRSPSHGLGCAECGKLLTASDHDEERPRLVWAWERGGFATKHYTLIHDGCFAAYHARHHAVLDATRHLLKVT